MQKVIHFEQIQKYSEFIDKTVIDYISDGQIETYESFDNYDLVAFDLYNLKNIDILPAQILVYIDKDDLFFICENEFSFSNAERFFVNDKSNEHALYLFFKNLFEGSTAHMERLENKVAALDDDVIDGTDSSLRERIIALRNEIRIVKKYYEQLEFLFDEICDNDNSLFSDDNMKYFEILRNRSIRLVSETVSLREYVTQVRESYQAQIGIEQSNLMKVFTLVTSIFMPLTLIAGWYGMNVKMPEFKWDYGYLFVAGVCVAVCAIWLIVFKKKKWL